jgi:hypothetical protein
LGSLFIFCSSEQGFLATAQDKIQISCQPMLKFPTNSGFHELILKQSFVFFYVFVVVMDTLSYKIKIKHPFVCHVATSIRAVFLMLQN